MKEIKVVISDEEYERIKSIVSWINVRNEFLNKEETYLVEDFIKGSTMDKLEDFKSMKPLFTPITSKTRIKNNFKKIAKEVNVRQVEICEKLEIDKAYLSQIFNNKVQPGLEVFLKIWALLGCPPMSKTIHFED